jgi:hypothetical protein
MPSHSHLLMNHRTKQFLIAAASLGCALTATAAERNPALDLLVKKGLITAEERAQALEQAAVAKMAEGPKKATWYDTLKIDGYTQVRQTEQMNDAAKLIGGLPADRSVDNAQSIVIRRARFKITGDIGRVSLYTQFDLAASVDSGTSRNFGMQTRDIYADIALDEDKEHRIRVGVSKVPYGWVNLQSSQNRLAIERPEALNSAVEGERDQGVYYMWADKASRALFKKHNAEGFKGSGDYAVFAAGFFGGTGLNKADNNGEVHSLIRFTYPWVTASGQMYEAGLGGYAGRFMVTPTAISGVGTPAAATERQRTDGFKDRRASAHFIMFPQPWGIEAEWTTGEGPQLNDARTFIDEGSLQGGYIQTSYRYQYGEASEFIPFVRWNYFDGARKFGTNAHKMVVNDLDLGFEWQWRPEVELSMMYSLTGERTNAAGTAIIKDARRLAIQLQFNY